MRLCTVSFLADTASRSELLVEVKAGELALKAGTFPPEALAVFRQHGVAMPHVADDTAPMTETHRRYKSADEHNRLKHGGDGRYDYGKTVKTRPCRYCHKGVEVPGTSVWWGKGRWTHLNGDTSDHPANLPVNTGDEPE